MAAGRIAGHQVPAKVIPLCVANRRITVIDQDEELDRQPQAPDRFQLLVVHVKAAVAIDARLSLKEKFSTALYARPIKDPFAQAVVKDARGKLTTLLFSAADNLRAIVDAVGNRTSFAWSSNRLSAAVDVVMKAWPT